MIGRSSSMKGSREDTVRTSMCSYEGPKFHASSISGWVILHLMCQIPGKPLNSQCVTKVNPRSWLPHLLLFSHSVVCDYLVTLWTVACQVPPSMGLSRQEYLSGGHFLLQGIFLTQRLNPSLLHLRQILYRWASREATPVRGLLIFRF